MIRPNSREVGRLPSTGVLAPRPARSVATVMVTLLAAGLVVSCRSPQDATAPPKASASAVPAASAARPDDPIPDTRSPYEALPPEVRRMIERPSAGDLDAMVARRLIRVGVTFNRTHYFIDRGEERGLTFEALKSFEQDLNARVAGGNLKVHVVAVPLSREQLHPALAGGLVDMVAAMITVRPELQKIAAFSQPTRTGVSQIVVTGPGAPPLTSVDDLSGREVFVRRTSAYYDTITALNAKLAARGRPAIVVHEAPDVLEDDDILEMVNAGLVPLTVVDDYLATFWQQVFTDITVRPDLALRTGGTLAVAFRKENPQLRAAVDQWIAKHGRADAFRAVVERRYLKNVTYAKNAAAGAERRKLRQVVDLFRKYGAQYDLDYLLMAAQGYQESTLDNSVKSPVGAIGVMQVMPSTGHELGVGDIKQLEPNIHAGVKYMRFMMDQYFKDEPMDRLNKGLMACAAYNAGPNRLRQLRREAAQRGLDPNVWFGNVERIASERIGRETVTYVSNIYKYYLAYRLLDAQANRQDAARAQLARSKKGQ